MNPDTDALRKPILSELLDDVVEVDSPVGGRKPIWTDEVDQLFEINDVPPEELARNAPDRPELPPG